ncbi:hypothetical protein AX16_003514 [Volvariella volvacea WC 439]|nr:hypothetical protein AX16_003514 [Volvariella volvacea WC 439]
MQTIIATTQAMEQGNIVLTAGAIVRASPTPPCTRRRRRSARMPLNPFVQLLGATLSWGLYGCLVVQFYAYYTAPAPAATTINAPPNGPKWLLYTIGILGVLESGYTVMMTHSVWVYIVDWHTTAVLQHPPGPWTSAVCPTITGLGEYLLWVLDGGLMVLYWKENMVSLRDVMGVVEAPHYNSSNYSGKQHAAHRNYFL